MNIVRVTVRTQLVKGKAVSSEVIDRKVLAEVDAKGALYYLKNPFPLDFEKSEGVTKKMSARSVEDEGHFVEGADS